MKQKTFCFFFSLILLFSQVSEVYAESVVNDVHSQINETTVLEIIKPTSALEIHNIVKEAALLGRSISVTGGRQAMGGQQFGTGAILIDMSRLNHVLSLNQYTGIADVEAGIQWPELIQKLNQLQKGRSPDWGIGQKETWFDRSSIGSAVSTNIHGRALVMKPIVNDVESLTLVDANGDIKKCSRTENSELFRLAIGGYGLFGIITTVQLRLAPRTKLQRVVEIIDVNNLPRRFEERIISGYRYGDFQVSLDRTSPDFMRKGIFVCYKLMPDDTPIPPHQKELSQKEWLDLIYLAHANPKKAWEGWSSYYLSTNGQIIWSDQQQLSDYVIGYHQEISERESKFTKASEMTTEIFVPQETHADFMEEVRKYFLSANVEVMDGTVQIVDEDEETYLPWARKPFVCTRFNIHVIHMPKWQLKVEKDIQALLDLGLKYQGTFSLAYHHYATKAQVIRAYPHFVDFLKMKKRYDPQERFQSNWYRFYRRMFSKELRNPPQSRQFPKN